MNFLKKFFLCIFIYYFIMLVLTSIYTILLQKSAIPTTDIALNTAIIFIDFICIVISFMIHSIINKEKIFIKNILLFLILTIISYIIHHLSNNINIIFQIKCLINLLICLMITFLRKKKLP
jgi:hypothetical protein